MSGSAGRVVGVIGGAAVTKLLTDTLASNVSMVASGIPNYIAAAVVAFAQGKIVGKLFKNPTFGSDMSIGGYAYVALRILSDFVPGLPNPFGLSGMGLITSSNAWGPPWVPVGSSMTKFVRPGGVPAPVVVAASSATGGMHGLGRVRRGGRLS